MSIGILIRLATERASLRHRDEAGLQVEIHIFYVDLRPDDHIVSRGSSELAKSLASHCLEGWWRWYDWFLSLEFSAEQRPAAWRFRRKLLDFL